MTEKSSYLAKDRLGDVISAIQVMGSNEAFAARVDYWAERITGDKKAAAQCEIIFRSIGNSFVALSVRMERSTTLSSGAIVSRTSTRKQDRLSQVQNSGSAPVTGRLGGDP